MKKIAQIILAVAIVALVYVIYEQISPPIKFDDELKAKKAQVIARIKDIRTAQRAFKSKYQRFTGSFDTLTNFILQDTLELERKIVDEDDSVAMAQLKKMGKKNVEKFKIAVIDTIFSPKRLSKQDVEQLRYIPGTDDKAQYIMEAGIITTESKVVIPIVECRAPYKMFLDTVAYRQEIINLIDNAIKYSVETVKIDIVCEEESNYTKIKVHDNGLGISFKEQNKIFDKFERADAGKRSNAGGFGLGLNYVQRVMTAHNGKVSLESIENKFSEFTLFFPVRDN